MKNVKTNEREWLVVGEFSDNDGHFMVVSQPIFYPWVKIEVVPCHVCGTSTPYILTKEQAAEIMRVAFGEEIEPR